MTALPPAPPGLPATLVSARAVPVAQRLPVALAVAALFALLASLMVWRGLSLPIAIGAFGATYLLLIVVTFSATLAAGDGWLARGERRFVRTDRLAAIETRVSISGTRVTLRDRDGRSMRVAVADLTANPVLWSLVRSGVSASLANGLVADARTRALFS